MKFPAVEDIRDIETSRVNIKTLDPLLYSAIETTTFICQYSHVALGKGMMATLSESKHQGSAEMVDNYGQKLAARILFTSHSAAASTCAVIVETLVNTYGAKSEVRDYWKQLHTRALPAKAFWNLHIKQLLN